MFSDEILRFIANQVNTRNLEKAGLKSGTPWHVGANKFVYIVCHCATLWYVRDIINYYDRVTNYKNYS